jgi:hypothetical protein
MAIDYASCRNGAWLKDMPYMITVADDLEFIGKGLDA